MGLRETLNQNPVVTSAVVGVITLLAVYVVGRQACAGAPEAGTIGAGQVWYSVDEGKTRFPDDATKVPPFKKDGKDAYRIVVYKCADGKEIVTHMERYPEEQRAAIEQAGGPGKSMQGAMSKEVKRPGDKAWISQMKAPEKFGKITQPTCPNATEVRP